MEDKPLSKNTFSIRLQNIINHSIIIKKMKSDFDIYIMTRGYTHELMSNTYDKFISIVNNAGETPKECEKAINDLKKWIPSTKDIKYHGEILGKIGSIISNIDTLLSSIHVLFFDIAEKDNIKTIDQSRVCLMWNSNLKKIKGTDDKIEYFNNYNDEFKKILRDINKSDTFNIFLKTLNIRNKYMHYGPYLDHEIELEFSCDYMNRIFLIGEDKTKKIDLNDELDKSMKEIESIIDALKKLKEMRFKNMVKIFE